MKNCVQNIEYLKAKIVGANETISVFFVLQDSLEKKLLHTLYFSSSFLAVDIVVTTVSIFYFPSGLGILCVRGHTINGSYIHNFHLLFEKYYQYYGSVLNYNSE